MTTSTMQAIEVEAPVRAVYNQWTQLEEFPKFMEGVESVEQLDDARSRWKTEVSGKEHVFDTRITEQLPDERIAWTTTHGDVEQAGVVTFHRLDENRTRVVVQMDVEPHGLVEKLGAKVGVLDRRVQGDLERFKAFIEERGRETGGWRGQIDRPTP